MLPGEGNVTEIEETTKWKQTEIFERNFIRFIITVVGNTRKREGKTAGEIQLISFPLRYGTLFPNSTTFASESVFSFNKV